MKLLIILGLVLISLNILRFIPSIFRTFKDKKLNKILVIWNTFEIFLMVYIVILAWIKLL